MSRTVEDPSLLVAARRAQHAIRLAVLWYTAATACSSDTGQPGTAAVQAWKLSDTPVVEIGVVEGDSMYQLFRANSALRLADGGIVVANTGTGQLRYFDASGRFRAKAGGRGGGPGEFRWLYRLYDHGPDSVLAFDQAGGRMSAFDTQGNLGGSSILEIATGETEFPMDVWLYRRNWVEGVIDRATRTDFATALDRIELTEATTGYRVVHVDPEQNLWVREPLTPNDVSRRWTIFDRDGLLRARTLTPARFETYQLGSDFVLGRWLNESDVEFIHLYDLGKPSPFPRSTSPPPAAHPPDDPAVDDAQLIGELKATLRNAVVLQERYYADHSTYAGAAAELDGEFPEGVTLDIVHADATAWVGVAVHAELARICAMGLGAATPPGWSEAVPKCSAAG